MLHSSFPTAVLYCSLSHHRTRSFSLCLLASHLIIQNWVLSLWSDGRRDPKSFPIDCLMMLWLGSHLEMSGRFKFLSSNELVWVGLQTFSDLLDTCLSCCTCPKNIWGVCSFLFVRSPTKKPTLKMPSKSGTTSEVGEKSTRFENSCINPRAPSNWTASRPQFLPVAACRNLTC